MSTAERARIEERIAQIVSHLGVLHKEAQRTFDAGRRADIATERSDCLLMLKALRDALANPQDDVSTQPAELTQESAS